MGWSACIKCFADELADQQISIKYIFCVFDKVGFHLILVTWLISVLFLLCIYLSVKSWDVLRDDYVSEYVSATDKSYMKCVW